MRNRIFLLLLTFCGLAFAQQPPPTGDQGTVDSRDQAAGKATPSRDTTPPPASTGTPPTNPNADGGTLHTPPPKATAKEGGKPEDEKKDAASGGTSDQRAKELDEQPKDVKQ